MKTKKTLFIPKETDRLLPKVATAVGLALMGATFAVNAAQGPQPTICTRSCWGARNGSCTTMMSSLSRAIIHHTAGSGDYTTDYNTAKGKVRGVQNLHMDNNGWCDIAYHFLVDAGGHIFEGREGSMTTLIKGSHAGCGNVNTFGFNFMGYFHSPYNQNPPTAMRDSMYDVIAWRMPSSWSPYGSSSYSGSLHGTAGNIETHAWVGAATGGGCGSTACPGSIIIDNYITYDYQGGEMRDGVDSRKNGGGSATPPNMAVFVRGGDGNGLDYRHWNGATWSSWVSLGGICTSDPSGVSWGANNMVVFVRGNDSKSIKYRKYNGSWGVWSDIGYPAAGAKGAPDACSRTGNQITVFVRGSDDALWYRSTGDGGSTWGSWTSLGGVLQSDPSAVASSPSRMTVFVRGSNGSTSSPLKYRMWAPTGWGSWVDLGGTLTSGPDACSWSASHMMVVVRGSDGQGLDYRSWNGSSWGSWVSLGGICTSDPGASSYAANRAHVFVRGNDGYTLKYRSWNGSSWSIWQSLGGILTSGPDACAWSNTAGTR